MCTRCSLCPRHPFNPKATTNVRPSILATTYCVAFSRQGDKNDLFGRSRERARIGVRGGWSVSPSPPPFGLLFWVRRPGQCPGSGPRVAGRTDLRTEAGCPRGAAMNIIIRPTDRPTDRHNDHGGERPQKSPQEHLPWPPPLSAGRPAKQACHKPRRSRRPHRLITTWGAEKEMY